MHCRHNQDIECGTDVDADSPGIEQQRIRRIADHTGDHSHQGNDSRKGEDLLPVLQEEHLAGHQSTAENRVFYHSGNERNHQQLYKTSHLTPSPPLSWRPWPLPGP